MAISKDTGSAVEIGFNEEERSKLQAMMEAIVGGALKAEYERGRRDERARCSTLHDILADKYEAKRDQVGLVGDNSYYRGVVDGLYMFAKAIYDGQEPK